MRNKLVDRINQRAMTDEGGDHGVRLNWRLATLAQKLAAIAEIEHEIAAFHRTLDAVLSEMGIDRHMFSQWQQTRVQLENTVRKANRQTSAGAKYSKSQQVEVECGTCTPAKWEAVPTDVRQCKEQGIPLDEAPTTLGVSHMVYEACIREVQLEEQPKPPVHQQDAKEVLTPNASPALYLQRHAQEYCRSLVTPSTPEQRQRVLYGIENDDGRRRKKWYRMLGINGVTLRAWEKCTHGDMKALSHDWQITLAGSDGEFAARALPQPILEQGVNPEKVLTHEHVLKTLGDTDAAVREKLRQNGLPEKSYECFAIGERKFHAAVNSIFPYLRMVDVRETSSRGMSITRRRKLEYDEAVAVLREVDALGKQMMEAGCLQPETYVDWLQFCGKAKRNAKQQFERANTLSAHEGNSAAAVPDTVPRRSKYEAARNMLEAYATAPSTELRNRIVEEYVPIVKHNAKKMWDRLPEGVELDDLMSAGTFGLMDAIDAFDPMRGVKFETYCVPRIRGAMIDELRGMDWVPRLVRSQMSKLKGAMTALQKAGDEMPSEDRIALHLGCAVQEVRAMLRESNMLPNVMSLERRLYETDSFKEVSEADTVTDRKAEDPASIIVNGQFAEEAMEYALAGFSRLEREVFLLYYIDQFTMKQIGDSMGLSESRVSQMHSVRSSLFRERLEGRLTYSDSRFPGEMDESAA